MYGGFETTTSKEEAPYLSEALLMSPQSMLILSSRSLSFTLRDAISEVFSSSSSPVIWDASVFAERSRGNIPFDPLAFFHGREAREQYRVHAEAEVTFVLYYLKAVPLKVVHPLAGLYYSVQSAALRRLY